MKSRRFDVCILGAVTVLFLPLVLGVGWGQTELVDRIVAIVNDDVITLTDLEETVEPYAMKVRSSVQGAKEEAKILSQLRGEILDRMIDEKLADQESERLGVSVSESEVDERLEQMALQQSLDREALEKVLEAEGYTWEEYRSRLKEQMLRVKLINMEVKSKIAITEKEIEDYYEAHKEALRKEKRYRLRTILIKVPSSATDDQRKKTLKRMKTVVDKFEKGGSFAELAKEYSEDGTGQEGGDLGFFLLEELSPEFRETVERMEEGEISPILQTPLGYQIVMVEEIESEAAKPLEEAKLQIQEKLYNQLLEDKYNTWLKELRERSYIKIIQ
jgi:peptidyl-prolyl cis-trans isomerase SurA